MAGGLGDPPDFALFWGYGGDHGFGPAVADRDQILAFEALSKAATGGK